MTILSVWAIFCAQRVASSSASGGALREAKNATKGLSKSSVFPDKSIKKRRRCINLPSIQALAALLLNKQYRQPTLDYISHTPSQSVIGIYTKRGHLIAYLQEYLKPPSLDTEDYDNKMSTNMYGTATEVVSRNKDKQNF